MKMLITGAGGQLGTDLAALCRDHGDTVTAVTHRELDIADQSAVEHALAHASPDAVINCAAWTQVDNCESDQARADLINGTGVGYLSSAAEKVGAHLVQVSTDYVFDGTKVGEYQVTDVPNPQSAYGRSKLLGEQLAGPSASVVRTSWVCSANGGNMVATILRLAAQHETLSFVSDQRGRPTFTTDLAVALRNLAVDRAAGLFHVANHGEVSWFEFTQAVFEAAGLDPARVHPVLTADREPMPAPRPANSVLATNHYEDSGHGDLRHFTQPLAETVPAYL